MWSLRAIIVVLGMWSIPVIFLLVSPPAEPQVPLFYDADFSPEAAIRGFSHIAFSDFPDGRPEYSIAFQKMVVHNSRIGPFLSGVLKVLRIKNLQLGSYEYSDAPVAQPDSAAYMESTEWQGYLLARVFDDLNKQDILDIRNVSEIVINGFEYEHFVDGHSAYVVSSASAKLLPGEQTIQMRGRVVLEDGSGLVCRTNHMLWDLKGDRFVVPGQCALTIDGMTEIYHGLEFDRILNITYPKRQIAER